MVREEGYYEARHLSADIDDVVLIFWNEEEVAFIIDGERWNEEEFAWVGEKKVKGES